MKLSVVVPFHDEEETLPRLETELLPILDGLGLSFEVLAVDDGSQDRSAERVERLAARIPALRLLRHAEQRGQGAAVRTGLEAATGDLIVTYAGDFTYPPVQIAKLVIRQLESGADCVAGTIHQTSKAQWHRRLGAGLINKAYRAWAGGLESWTPSFRLYKSSAVKELTIASDGPEAHAEILLQLVRAGKKIEEVPVELRPRAEGRSKKSVLGELRRHLALSLRYLFK